MKRILQKTLLTIACLLCSIVASAHDFGVDGIYYDITSKTDKTVEVVYEGLYYTKYTGTVVIPETVTYKGTTYSVTSIRVSAFYECTGLTSITIPNSVTSIGGASFNGCSKLTEIVVKEGNTVYDSRENCNAIIETTTNTLITGCKNTIIPNSVTSIGDVAFSYCTGLTSITIPNSVTSIGNRAFYKCTGLASITIPNSVTSIGDYTFYECTGLTSIIIPNSVTSIGQGAFSGCSKLTEIVVKEGNTVFDSRENCNAIIETATNKLIIGCENTIIPNSVTSIGEEAFYGCSGLTSITIPNGVTSIDNYTFYGCAGLTSITIPSSVTSIGDYAFYKCTGLTSIIIPNSVTSIGESAFAGCINLKKVINCSNFTLNYRSEDYGSVALYANCIINAPNGYIEGDYVWYKNEGTKILAAYLGNATELSLPDNYGKNYRIGFAAFWSCTGLTSITIPNGVTSIGNSAFERCTGLTSITIPNSVTSIGDYAFYKCTGLTSIIIPNSVTSIGNYAFEGCENLKKVINCSNFTLNYDSKDYGWVGYYANLIINAPNGYIEGDYVWYENEGTNILAAYLGNATELSLPDNYGENYRIGFAAFYGCTGLTSITIPNGVTSIGRSAFNLCTGLASITIPNSVTSIGDYAFYKCTGLTSVTIPNSVTSIGDYAFYKCTGLTSIIIPNSVTSIGQGAFEDCTGLKKILWNAQNCQSAPWGDIASQITSFEFGWDVEDIPSRLCKGMTELSNVAIPNTTRTIGDNTFDGCSGLRSVTLGNKLRSIGDNAFNGCDRIKDVYAYPTQPPTIYANTFTYYVNDNATLHTIIGCKKDYEEALYWNYFYNIKQDLSAGIEGVKAEEAFSVAVVGGTLAIAGAADDAVVNIYNTNGALLHNTTVAGAADIALPNGIYLVQVNGVTKKVVL